MTIRQEDGTNGRRATTGRDELLLFREYTGVEFHDFFHVGHKVGQAVVARIRMIFVLYTFCLQLLVESCRTLLKAKIIRLPAVKIDRELFQTSLIFFCQHEDAVLLPVTAH